MVTGRFIPIADVDRCWCGHLKRFHVSLFVKDVCRWCTKMEQRHPNFNFTPRHQFMQEGPITQDVAQVLADQLRGEGGVGWLKGMGDTSI